LAEHFREGYDAATECVGNYPATAMLVTFAAGFGVGLLLGHALAEPPPEERKGLARFGRQVLETMSRYMPEALAKRVGA
jgi:hypothetical protein